MGINVPHLRLVLRMAALAAGLALSLPSPAAAQDRLCDPGNEDCRQILINHIRAEKVGLDVAFWFMEDPWIADEVIARWNNDVPVRIIMDSRANGPNPRNAQRLAAFKAAGIPMRERTAAGIMHWKLMLFAGQGIVEFSGANYSSDAWVYSGAPLTNYVDESIYFTGKPSVVNTFKTKFDDLWTNTTSYADYANIDRPLWRVYDTYPFDPELNFPPEESYAVRAVAEYYREQQKMDVIMYRITDRRHSDALIDLHQRGLPIRLITDPAQYRDPNRLWHSWNVDRMWKAGIAIKHRVHAGLNHQKSVLLYGHHMTIFGSSNWTSPSAHSQEEHNYFTHDSFVFDWFVDQFERKWNNSAGVIENEPFQPLPPGRPDMPVPASDASNIQISNLVLRWDGSPWAHIYDIYLGTSPGNLVKVGDNVELGPSQWTGDLRSFTLRAPLQPGTRYYWQVVGKTMAGLTNTGSLWTFVTDPGATPVVLPQPWSSSDIGAVGIAGNAGASNGTFTVNGSGADVWGTADQMHYVWQPVTGDVDIVARVASIENVHAWTKAGVMIRGSLDASAPQAFMLASPGKGLAFQRRLTAGGQSVGTSGATTTAPVWVKLERRGNVIRAFQSPDGTTWTAVGSDTFAMGSQAYVGLAISSHDNTRLAMASFDNVSLIRPGGGEPPNTAPSVSLSSPASGATFVAPATITLTASASDVDGSVTQVRFYRGTTLIGTVNSAPYTFSWQNVPAGTYNLTAQATDDDNAVSTSAAITVTVQPASSLPAPWVSGDIGAVGLAGSASESGGLFTVRATGLDIWGTADALHFVSQPVTGDFDVVARVPSVEYVHAWTKAGVMIRGARTAGAAQAMMVVSPGKGLAYQRRPVADGLSTSTPGGAGTAPMWVKLERRGSTITAFISPTGSAWTQVGSDTFTMDATVHVGLALSSHDNSRLATATFDNVSITPAGGGSTPANAAPSVTLTSPANGATFTAPATLTLAANAADTDGSIATVEFLSGSTVLGTATGSPYQIAWTDVPAGTYTLRARATDDLGTVTTSAPITVTVNPATSLPAGWSSQDVGAVGLPGSAAFSGGTFTLNASGADIWGNADALHFAWQPVTGDVDVIARVSSVEWVHHWTKAGVMIRESVAAGSAQAMMLVSPGKGLAFQRRTATDGVSTSTGTPGVAPRWVKLERRGNTITAYESANGSDWTLVASDTFAMGAEALVGLGLTSHDNTRIARATFDNVQVIAR